MLLDPQVNANALTWAADANKARTSASVSVGKGSSLVRGVEAMERCGNRRPRVERLISAWKQGIRGDAEAEGEADDPLIGTSAEPKKRPRTPLTDSEVDAIRTARERGVSVNALARQFGVHRATVWAKTRTPNQESRQQTQVSGRVQTAANQIDQSIKEVFTLRSDD